MGYKFFRGLNPLTPITLSFCISDDTSTLAMTASYGPLPIVDFLVTLLSPHPFLPTAQIWEPGYATDFCYIFHMLSLSLTTCSIYAGKPEGKHPTHPYYVPSKFTCCKTNPSTEEHKLRWNKSVHKRNRTSKDAMEESYDNAADLQRFLV